MCPTSRLLIGRRAFETLHRIRPTAILHLVEDREGAVKITVLYDPPISPGAAYIPDNVAAIAAKMLRVALENGAKEA